jgi:hypothetical protein
MDPSPSVYILVNITEPVFLKVSGAQELIPRNEFRHPMKPGGQVRRYDNPIPNRFLAPIDCLKIPALYWCTVQ